MTEPGLIVIGSGPAGISAAEAFRRSDQQAPILVITTDPDLPYERPPLSKDYLRRQTEDVALNPPQWYADRAIELIFRTGVDAIDADGHNVTAAGRTHTYSALVIATGAAPTALPVPGGEHAVSLRSLTDATRLRDRAAGARSAVVIGAGFIGCEAAASLALQGISVSLVAPEELPQAKRLGDAAGTRLRQLVADSGARFVGGVSVEAIEQRDDGLAVRLDNGVTVDCDLVLAATGVRPESAIAGDAGIDLQESRIVVGADMRTSVADVYAAGDVAFAYNSTAQRHIAVEHWQDADDHGAIAGANAAGESESWSAVPGFWSTIGDAEVKYTAWGDGYQRSRLVERDGGFTIWYESDGAVVGVLTHRADDDYELGESLITAKKPAPVSMS